jgi:uncharacterized protein
VFAVGGEIAWRQGLLMATGGMLGGFLAARMVRWTNRQTVRRIILAIGFIIAAYYFWRIYGRLVLDLGGD